jgi:succinyl-CoA:acetate CoA-transferase
MDYFDMHLSQVAPRAFGPLDVALIEVTAINEDGTLMPSSSVATTRPGSTVPTNHP